VQTLSNRQKQKVKTNILSLLDNSSLKDQIEILGNIFIDIGLQKINIDNNVNINTKNIYEIVLNDVEKNGDTLENSLTRQGLIILSWLNKE